MCIALYWLSWQLLSISKDFAKSAQVEAGGSTGHQILKSTCIMGLDLLELSFWSQCSWTTKQTLRDSQNGYYRHDSALSHVTLTNNVLSTLKR